MFITGHSYVGLFLLVVVSNFVAAIDASDNSEYQDAFPTGVGKDETHLIVKRTSEHMDVKRSAAKTERCMLFDFDAVLLVHDPGNYTNAKHSAFTMSSQSLPNRRCTIGPPNDKRDVQIDISLLSSVMYKIALEAKKSADGKSWYVDYFEVTYLSYFAFGHSNYGHERRARTRLNENFMETPIDKSFSCTRLWKVLLYNKQGKHEVELHFNKIKMQFYNIGDGDKYSPESMCSASPVYAAITWLELVAIWLLYHFV